MSPIIRFAQSSLRTFVFTCIVALPVTAQQPVRPATTACKIDATPATDADRAYYHGEQAKAAPLFEAQYKANHADNRSHELWIDSLISSGKISEASRLADEWAAAEPATARAVQTESEVRQTEGDWLEAYALALKALKLDPCLPDAYQALGIYEESAGYHATARKHFALAHQLEPNDDVLRLSWIDTLDPASAIEEFKKLLNSDKSISDANRKRALQGLEKSAALTENKCELKSASMPVVIPLTPVQHGIGVDYYGLEIAFNGHKRILQIDTGASGFVLTHGATGGLSLPKVDSSSVHGFGNDGSTTTTINSAHSIEIGGLQFQNCYVQELNQIGIMGGDSMGLGARLDASDGIVGTDIFSRYLVTLDYIKHEIRLDALPEAPAEAGASRDTLGGINDQGSLVEDRYIAPSMKSWTSIYRMGHTLIIPSHINGSTPSLFVLDTGSIANLIDTKFAAKVTTIKDSGTRFQGMSGVTAKSGETRAFTLDFANVRLPIKSMDSQNLSSFRGVNGFIGYPTLQQLVIRIDYRDNLLSLGTPASAN